MSAGLPIDVDPEDVALEMLKAELPGFESRIVAASNAIGIRGALPIAMEASRDVIFWPIMRSPTFVDVKARSFFDALESDEARALRHARQREALKAELEPVIDHIAERIREYAIKAVGLEKVIAERERKARIDGQRVGHEIGRQAGYRDGRDDGFAAGLVEGIRKASAAIADVELEGDEQ